jgi:hypothetical protein
MKLGDEYEQWIGRDLEVAVAYLNVLLQKMHGMTEKSYFPNTSQMCCHYFDLLGFTCIR